MATETTKIVELKEATSINDTDLFLLTNNSASNKLSYTTLKNKLNTDIIGSTSIDDITARLTTAESNIQGNSDDIVELSDNMTNILSIQLSVDSLCAAISDLNAVIGNTTITGTITQNISSLIDFQTTKPTDTSYGPIKVGYSTTGNNHAVQVDDDGNAYVEVTATGSKPENYDEVSSQVFLNKNDILSNSLSIQYNLSAITELSNIIMESETVQLSDAIYGDDQLCDVVQNTVKHTHNIIWRLYDAEWREVTTKITQSTFDNALSNAGFDLQNESLIDVSCFYNSENSWYVTDGSRSSYNVQLGISCQSIYTTDDTQFVVGDLIVYTRDIQKENEVLTWSWHQNNEFSQISSYNISGEILQLSNSVHNLSNYVNDLTLSTDSISTYVSSLTLSVNEISNYVNDLTLSTASISTYVSSLTLSVHNLSSDLENLRLSSQVIFNQILFETSNKLIINTENLVDEDEKSFIRLKLYNSNDDQLTVTVNNKDLEINAKSYYTYDELKTVKETQNLIVDTIPTGLQFNVIIYKNCYPMISV